MDPSKLSVRLVQLESNGRLEPLSGPVFPSFPCPVVKVTAIEIRNISFRPQEGDLVCDLTIRGSVSSALSGTLSTEDANIEQCLLYVNGDDKPVAELLVKAQERGPATALLSAPFRGVFDVEVKGVRVTDGNNTFKVVAADKVYALQGHSMWAARIVTPDDDDNGQKPAKAAVAEKPEPVSGGTGGELYLYGLIVDGVPAAEASKLTLTIGDRSPINCGLIAGNSGSYLAKRPDTELPLLFTFRPASFDKADSKLDAIADEKGVNASPSASLPEREAFLSGFSAGSFFYGADVVAGTKLFAVRAMDFSPITGLLTLHSHLSLDNHSLRDFNTPLPTRFAPQASPVETLTTTPELAWHLTKLYRSNDPRAKEVTLVLLLGNYEDVGLKSTKIEDWRSELFSVMAELLDSLFEENKRMAPHDQGYLIGRSFCEVARVCAIPGTRFPLETTPKSQVLQQLVKSHFFSQPKTLAPTKAKKPSIIDAVKKMFGR